MEETCFDRTKAPPKIVTRDGTLVLKAGDEGDIVFEPSAGRRVLIGGNALVRHSSLSFSLAYRIKKPH